MSGTLYFVDMNERSEYGNGRQRERERERKKKKKSIICTYTERKNEKKKKSNVQYYAIIVLEGN
jgi:hypothetical protein